MKVPLSDKEHTLLRDLVEPRRAAVTFPHDQADARRLYGALAGQVPLDLTREDLEALTRLLGIYLDHLAGAGVPVPATAPLDSTVELAAEAPALQHIHAQLVRHLAATE